MYIEGGWRSLLLREVIIWFSVKECREVHEITETEQMALPSSPQTMAQVD